MFNSNTCTFVYVTLPVPESGIVSCDIGNPNNRSHSQPLLIFTLITDTDIWINETHGLPSRGEHSGDL